mmetsp:Transcript_34840/g.77455  ORF Transcript_34840/g.77455 Transcript_34840/m.77455 type:complete len:145 (-) Transcript_34840:453-887(-)
MLGTSGRTARQRIALNLAMLLLISLSTSRRVFAASASYARSTTTSGAPGVPFHDDVPSMGQGAPDSQDVRTFRKLLVELPAARKAPAAVTRSKQHSSPASGNTSTGTQKKGPGTGGRALGACLPETGQPQPCVVHLAHGRRSAK